MHSGTLDGRAVAVKVIGGGELSTRERARLRIYDWSTHENTINYGVVIIPELEMARLSSRPDYPSSLCKIFGTYRYRSADGMIRDIVVMERFDHDLFERIFGNKRWQEHGNSWMVEKFLEIAKGIEYALQHSIVLGDIKLENIFLRQDDSVAVGDYNNNFTPRTVDLWKHLGTFPQGTPEYRAPEIAFTPRPPTENSIIYAFGMMFLRCMVTASLGTLSNDVKHDQIDKVRQHLLPAYQPGQPGHALFELALACTRRNPQERPSLADVIEKLNQLL